MVLKAENQSLQIDTSQIESEFDDFHIKSPLLGPSNQEDQKL